MSDQERITELEKQVERLTAKLEGTTKVLESLISRLGWSALTMSYAHQLVVKLKETKLAG